MFIYIVQIIGFIIFGIVGYVAWRRREFSVYALATIYAALFENLDVFMSRGTTGSYFYDPDLFLIIVETPLFIILAWGVIFYSSYTLARGLTKKFWAQALTAPLLATIIDLPLDPVATKFGLWTWVGYGANDGIFGVPLANFMGWYLVIFALMLCLRIAHHIEFLGRFGKYIFVPLFSFGLFIIIFGVFQYTAVALGINMHNQFNYLQLFFPIIASVCLVSWLIHKERMKIKLNHFYLLLVSRLLFYAFSIIGAVVYGFWREPLFIAIIIFALVLEGIANFKFKFNAKT